ncbi:MAG TPA: ABC transporter ATP-binding protein [Thermomicrobiales bacterium]|nr:ABC transporter ATP-binding protein [Thermomicrobiales bacterium]
MSKTIAKPRAASAIHDARRDRQPSIELRDVRKLFGEVAAVDGVSLAIEPGEFLTLLGPSGCGKTTTLRMIGGFEFPTAGEVYIDGEAMGARPPYRRPVNTVFQNYALFPHLTVGQNVAYGLEMQRTPKAERRERVAAALAMVRLPQVESRKPSELSGGQQQRVALARALVNRPAVLLLDEPLGALDLKLRKAMQLELKQLNREVGATFVYVTHDQEEALTMSDRIAVMNEGRILQVGPPADIYERPRNRFVADFIGQTNFLDVTILGVVVDQANVQIPGSPPVRVRLPAGGATRGPATLAIRPEKVFLMDDFGGAAPARWNALDATLVDVIYLGTHTHYVARLLGGAFVAVHRQNRAFGEAEPRVGDPIRIGFDPMSAMLLGE